MSMSVGSSVKFNIPASFIVDWAKITPGELRYGYANGWMTSKDVVELALCGVVPADDKMGTVEEISLLLSDELDRVPDLVDELSIRDEEVWVYLALAWVRNNQDEFDDPFKAVDLLFADFGCPDDVGEFVTFMPPPTGGVPGIDGLSQRWQAYLSKKRSHYLRRGSKPSVNRTGSSKPPGRPGVGAWRPLPLAAARVIRMIVQSSRLVEAGALIDQLQGAVARKEAPWILDIEVDAEVARVTVPDGPIPVRALVADEGEYRGEVLIWVTNGLLSGLEYAWVTDEPPTCWPEPGEIRVG